ncbi:PAQR family membrane homeostasis protein TrhA [Aureitalea marina]|uniref:Hemolysin III family protein n=1 Tax=Aureitalea marina TaxID=930804 RepID=A0A2S7KNT1_9FLAO|nr:hemolysin III family protein [Aureitalea marina]PQB04267.1 hemolysin III family protein [Aureitalea marina]
MYSKREELWNVITHGAGVLLSIAGLFVMLAFDQHKSEYSTFSIWLYGVSLILLYSASTAYHLATDPDLRRKLRIMDHISIYYLIAGTYTPVSLISLVDGNGWTIFWTVWGIALFGTFLKIFFTGRFEKLSLLLYLVMGWLIIFDISNLINVQSTLGLTLMALGGACYTFGTVFYVVERIPFNHAIWHIWVLAGSIFHFFFILLDVI